MKKVFLTILPVIFLVIFASCAGSTCKNDACYNRRLASVDPYKDGEVAAWGSENQEAADEEEQVPVKERFRQERE